MSVYIINIGTPTPQAHVTGHSCVAPIHPGQPFDYPHRVNGGSLPGKSDVSKHPVNVQAAMKKVARLIGSIHADFIEVTPSAPKKQS